jgi:hypothetical protein
MSTTIANTTKHTKLTDTKSSDFLLVFMPETDCDTFADAVHALYYLPESYRLIVIRDEQSTEPMPCIEPEDLMHRIQFIGSKDAAQKTSPLAKANATIYDETILNTPTSIKQPAVVVLENAVQSIEANNWGGFTVSAGRPEALASAALRIAQARI